MNIATAAETPPAECIDDLKPIQEIESSAAQPTGQDWRKTDWTAVPREKVKLKPLDVEEIKNG